MSNSYDLYVAAQRAFVEDMRAPGRFNLRCPSGGLLRPSRGVPYVFTSKGEAWATAVRCSDGPIIAGQWEVVDAPPED